HGSVAVLEFAGRARRGIWLGPAERAGAENPAAGAGPDAAGIRDQEFPERGIRSGGTPGGAAIPGESPAGTSGVCEGGSGVVRAHRAARERVHRERFSVAAFAGAGDRSGTLADFA